MSRQVVFIGLSAVTVPHMIITEVAQVRQRALESSRRFSTGGEGDDGGEMGGEGGDDRDVLMTSRAR